MNDQPISVLISNMESELVEVLKKYSLHPTIAKLVVKNFYDHVRISAESQYEIEKKAYEESKQEVDEGEQSILSD